MGAQINEPQTLVGEPKARAACYVRMSTEHQQYSTDNQISSIDEYARARGFEVVRTYADEGKSGLRIEGRAALQRLIADIESKTNDFSAVLVYDVSRWGRFQDPDEAASYELRCRLSGVEVHYCAEQFENDGSIGSAIIKTVKRAMAGEYSRELSAKVFQGQARLVSLGYRQGGAAGYGLRRLLIDRFGVPRAELAPGEQKSIATDRVVLVPGPAEEVEIVREIYRLFVDIRMIEKDIAHELNSRGICTDLGRPWTRGTVHQILINEKYIGHNVWARNSYKLKNEHVVNRPAEWIRLERAFTAIVDEKLFSKAADIIMERTSRISDDALLRILGTILKKRGTLSGLIIDEWEDGPSSSAYRSRFGSLLRAYTLIGFTPEQDYRYLDINRNLRRIHPDIVSDILDFAKQERGRACLDPATDLITINGEFTLSIVVCRCRRTQAGSRRWHIRFDTALRPDITIAARMDEDNTAVQDYYILPATDIRNSLLRLCDHNGFSLDTYRFQNLERLRDLIARAPFRRVA